jgi:hypothetical protein
MPHVTAAKPANLSAPEARVVAAAPVARGVSPTKSARKMIEREASLVAPASACPSR